MEAGAAINIEESRVRREPVSQRIVRNRNTLIADAEERFEHVSGVKGIFPITAGVRGVGPGTVRPLCAKDEPRQAFGLLSERLARCKLGCTGE